MNEPRPPMIAGNSVRAIIPQSIEEIVRVSKYIAAAGWCPKGYLVDHKNPSLGFDEHKIAVGIMHGLEVGLTPIAALQSIAVINGTPSIFGDGMLALIQSSGHLENFSEVEIQKDGKPFGYKVTAKRKLIETPYEAIFTLADAAAANLTTKPGPWQQYPLRMCKWRARSWALRAGFSDVLRGLSSAEEVQDMIDVTPPPAPKPKSATAALDSFSGVVVEHTPAPAPAADPVDPPVAPEPPVEAMSATDELPEMPDEVAGEWADGKWGAPVTWLLNIIPTLNDDQKVVMVDSYNDIIEKATSDKKQGPKVTARFAAIGVML